MVKFGTQPPIPKHQADATIDQANPVSGTEYEWSSDGTQTNKLGTQRNTIIESIWIKITYTGTDDANDKIEIIVTVDGKTITYILAGTSLATATSYFPQRASGSAPSVQTLATNDPLISTNQSPLHKGRSVKVVAKVTDGGISNLAYTQLDVRVKWAKY